MPYGLGYFCFMATIKVAEQKKVSYRSLSMAQIEDALITYSEDQTAVSGLNAIKDAKTTEMDGWYTCTQCLGIGRLDNGSNVCPLCNGEGKTQNQWSPDRGPIISFTEIEP